jgi:hypothetical protein
MTKENPPLPEMKPTPTVMREIYQIPFMYSGIPIDAPRFQFSKAEIPFICAMYWLKK